MVDRAELRRLAEICADKEPIERNDIEFIDCGTGWVRDQWNYIAAASPDVVLGLLDELDQLRAVAVRLKEALDDVASEAPTDPALWMKYTQEMARNALADPEVEKL